MMYPSNDPQNENELGLRKLKTGVGLVLLAIGVDGMYLIAQSLMALADGPQNIPLLSKYLAFDTAARTIITPSGNVVLPEGLYYTSGLFIYLIALSIAAGLTKVLVMTGASLLENNFASVLKSIREELAKPNNANLRNK